MHGDLARFCKRGSGGTCVRGNRFALGTCQRGVHSASVCNANMHMIVPERARCWVLGDAIVYA